MAVLALLVACLWWRVVPRRCCPPPARRCHPRAPELRRPYQPLSGQQRETASAAVLCPVWRGRSIMSHIISVLITPAPREPPKQASAAAHVDNALSRGVDPPFVLAWSPPEHAGEALSTPLQLAASEIGPLGCPSNTLRPCSGHGSCNPNGHCSCDRGFSGSACDRFEYLVGCPQNCTAPNGKCFRGRCICNRGFSGDDCADRTPVNCSISCAANGRASASMASACADLDTMALTASRVARRMSRLLASRAQGMVFACPRGVRAMLWTPASASQDLKAVVASATSRA